MEGRRRKGGGRREGGREWSVAAEGKVSTWRAAHPHLPPSPSFSATLLLIITCRHPRCQCSHTARLHLPLHPAVPPLACASLAFACQGPRASDIHPPAAPATRFRTPHGSTLAAAAAPFVPIPTGRSQPACLRYVAAPSPSPLADTISIRRSTRYSEALQVAYQPARPPPHPQPNHDRPWRQRRRRRWWRRRRRRRQVV